MIIALDKLKTFPGFEDLDNDDWLEFKLKSLETTIVNLTNNNFIDKNTKICSYFQFSNNQILGLGNTFDSYKEGDTILVLNSKHNNGYYTVKSTDGLSLTLDSNMAFNSLEEATIAKVVYPTDVVMGVVKLIEYDLKMADKLGVKSETISRYSVTYYDVTSNESIEGYPASLLGFLKKYRRLRW